MAALIYPEMVIIGVRFTVNKFKFVCVVVVVIIEIVVVILIFIHSLDNCG